MKLLTLISALATSAALVSAEAEPKSDPRHQIRSLDLSPGHLHVRDKKCPPPPMCKTPASAGPKDPPACASSFKACKFDKFPCEELFTPKWTDNTHHCYCILATKKAMNEFCQEQGFKGGSNTLKHHYAVHCYGAANDQVCKKDCQLNDLGNGKINKANPGGVCQCDKPYPSPDWC